MPAIPTPLDLLLAVLKSPALAAEFTPQAGLWQEIKRFAEIHRFSGLLAHSTSAWLPASERPWRDRVLMQHHRRHAQRLQALALLVEAFRAEGLPCVPLKGPLLAERFYPVPFLRPSNDLDLLIHERDVGSVVRLMRKLGFQLEDGYPWNLQRRVNQHLTFTGTDESPRVEIHYRWLAGGILIDASEFTHRTSNWRSPSGLEASVLSNADEAFYCCIHAASHAFHRLRWLYDVMAIARSLQPRERIQVRELATRHAQAGAFVAATMAAREFFGETPALGYDDLPSLWTRLTPRQTRSMVERVEGNTATLSEKVGYRLDLFRMTESPAQAARLLVSTADREIRKKWYGLRRPVNPEILAQSLPD
jgi:Uncharacterised nucleotidyltransferase